MCCIYIKNSQYLNNSGYHYFKYHFNVKNNVLKNDTYLKCYFKLLNYSKSHLFTLELMKDVTVTTHEISLLKKMQQKLCYMITLH